MKGTIVLWHQARAYGFVKPDGSDETIFVHISNFCPGEVPRLDARIEFEIGDPISIGKKPQAINATILSIPMSVGLAALQSAANDETGGAK
jgi:cold shock CspA family protein